MSMSHYSDHALIHAASNGHTIIVGMLLYAGVANPTANNSEALRVAFANGYYDIVKMLLNDGRIGRK